MKLSVEFELDSSFSSIADVRESASDDLVPTVATAPRPLLDEDDLLGHDLRWVLRAARRSNVLPQNEHRELCLLDALDVDLALVARLDSGTGTPQMPL